MYWNLFTHFVFVPQQANLALVETFTCVFIICNMNKIKSLLYQLVLISIRL